MPVADVPVPDVPLPVPDVEHVVPDVELVMTWRAHSDYGAATAILEGLTSPKAEG